jgi:hypothetical protein
MVSLKQVHQMMHFKCYYGQEYNLQDLQWLQELLEISCDEELRNKICNKLKEIPANKHGRALYYYLMIELIQVDTDNVVCSLTTKLSNMNIGTLGRGECDASLLFDWRHPQSSQAHGQCAA